MSGFLPTIRARLGTSGQAALKTASAAGLSYISAAAMGMKEGYWAAIAAAVVMQADLASTRNAGWDRFLGTVIGAIVGLGCAEIWHGNVLWYALGVAVSVLLCSIAGLTVAARLAAVTVSVIVLIPRQEPVWQVSLLRFLEVSWGIAVALLVAGAAERLGSVVKRKGASPEGQDGD